MSMSTKVLPVVVLFCRIFNHACVGLVDRLQTKFSNKCLIFVRKSVRCGENVLPSVQIVGRRLDSTQLHTRLNTVKERKCP